MKEYATRDIANMVDIAPATVRKYAQKLELAGHRFTKDGNGFRIFLESDIELFAQMKEMSNATGMTVESIAEKLVKQAKGNTEEAIQDEAEVDTPTKKDDAIQIEVLLEEVRSLKEMVRAQQQYIEERDQHFLDALQRLQEGEQSSIESAASDESATTRKEWWKLWK